MAYVYQHIRLDSNKVFYIGIGLDNEGKYRRAKCKGNRNRYWLNIVNKHGYTVEILLDGLTWEDALLKEVEYIKMFGRKQFGGSLINLTDGGDGNTGYVTSDETKKKQSQLKKGWKPPHSWKMFTPEAKAKRAATVASRKYTSWNKGKKTKPETIEKWKIKMKGRPSNAKGRKWSQEAKDKISISRKGIPAWNKGISPSAESREKMRVSSLGQIAWNKGVPMSKESREKLSNSLKGHPSWNKGKKMSTEFSELISKRMKAKPVLQKSLSGDLIINFFSAKEAGKELGINADYIRMVCRGDYSSKNYKGFIWEYAT